MKDLHHRDVPLKNLDIDFKCKNQGYLLLTNKYYDCYP